MVFLHIFIFTGCKNVYKEYTRTAFAFDTYAIITIKECDSKADKKAVCDEAIALLSELDNDLSVTKSDSEISKLNKSAFKEPVSVKSYVYELIEQSIELCEKTNGCFDITLGKIIKLFGFTDRQPPQFDKINNLKGKKNYKNIILDDKNKTVYFTSSEFEIDLGAIAKGYALDRIKELLKEAGVLSAVVDLGGCIISIGSNDLSVGVTYDETDSLFAKIKINEQIISTSNGSKRYIEYDGVRYHHIIDANTGFPAESEIQSVTVISDSGVYADALSTALFVNGNNDPNKIISIFSNCSYIIYYKNGSVLYSDDLKDKIYLYE